jgi:anti-anti-sigma factor
MGPPPNLEIAESRTETGVRLKLSGELDLASCQMLDDRLARLRVMRSPVRLNLARLEFIDSTGIHLLIRTVGEARVKGWHLEIERDIHPQVMRMFKLVHLDRFVASGPPGSDGAGPQPDGDGVPRSAPVEPSSS